MDKMIGYAFPILHTFLQNHSKFRNRTQSVTTKCISFLLEEGHYVFKQEQWRIAKQNDTTLKNNERIGQERKIIY